MATTTNNQIGGNYVVLCNTKREWWVDWSRHYATVADARASMRPGHANNVKTWLCERTATISDDGVNAVVEYAITNYKGERIGAVEISWTRGGEPIWTDNQKAPFSGYGAGLGYEGSDYAKVTDVEFLR